MNLAHEETFIAPDFLHFAESSHLLAFNGIRGIPRIGSKGTRKRALRIRCNRLFHMLEIGGATVYIFNVSSETMDINAHVISGSDPGAVPGGSTKTLRLRDMRGRNRIDGRLKVLALSRRGTTVIGPQSIIANDNHAPVALAA